jgi:hypothetical protein
MALRLLSWLAPTPKQSSAGLVAAATIVSQQSATDPYRSKLLPDEQEWQREAWGYWDSLGMFRNAVMWKADMLSRVRLRAAKKDAGQDEPTILDVGPAADLISELSAGAQSGIMSNLAVYLSVPGEGFIIGETLADGRNVWTARSTDEVRYRPTAASRYGTAENAVSPYQVVDERSAGNTIRWRSLSAESLVVRVWRPHKRFFHIADSSARAARSTMRELELANRHIVSQYLSRIASAGLLVLPNEVTFPVREEFQDAADPFVAEWIEIAAEAISTPGSASAVVPMPIRIAAEYVDKVQHIDFTMKLDQKIIEKREAADKRLAMDLDVPPESLLGMADINHWSGWLIEETSFKRYLAPDTELICQALTEGYLHPRLLAAGESIEDIVVWYDASEITIRPDRSDKAVTAYGLGEISGEALRREIGFDEDDKPSNDELIRMILLKLSTDPATAFAALKELTGVYVEVPIGTTRTIPTDAPAVSGAEPEPSPTNTPPEQPVPPPDGKPGPGSEAHTVQLLKQARLPHAIRISPLSNGGYELLHPAECQAHLFQCPVNTGTWGDFIKARPGSPGAYQCYLAPDGSPRIGTRMTDAAVVNMLPTLSPVVR